MINKNSWISVAIILGIIIVINMILSNVQARFDFTKNNVYTISDVTKNTLDLIDDPITIKIFYTEKMPKQYLTVQQYVFDILEEYKAQAGSALEYEFLEIGEGSDDVKAEAQSLGIQVAQANISEQDQIKVQQIYFGIAFLLGDKKEVIPFVNKINQLEYDFTGAIKRLTAGGKKKIALITGNGEFDNAQAAPFSQNNDADKNKIRKLASEISSQYELVTLDLNTVEQIDGDIDVAFWIGPSKAVTEKTKYIVDQFLMRGGRLGIYLNNQTIDFKSYIPIMPMAHGLIPFFENYGIRFNDNIVVDKQAAKIQQTQEVGPLRIPIQVDYPFIPIMVDFPDQPIVNRLDQMQLIFASSIDSVSGKNVRFTPILQSSEQSGFAVKNPQRNMYDPNPKQFFNFNQKHITMAAVVEGEFTSNYQSVPDTISYPQAHLVKSAMPSKILAVADADFLNDEYLQRPYVDFFMNTIDWLVDENGLISIRSKNIEINPLDKDIIAEDAAGTRNFLKALNVFLAPFIVIIFGLMRWFIRRKTKQLSANAR